MAKYIFKGDGLNFMIINADVMLTPGVRKAIKITEQELKYQIMEEARKHNPEYFKEFDDLSFAVAMVIDYADESDIKHIDNVAELVSHDPNYCFNGWDTYHNGNFTKKDSEHYLGLHTINNFTFYGCLCAIWSHLFYVVIYSDGNKLRVYSPIHGNRVGIFDDECIPLSDDDESDEYAQKYGFASAEDVAINWDAIKNDILTVIQVQVM